MLVCGICDRHGLRRSSRTQTLFIVAGFRRHGSIAGRGANRNRRSSCCATAPRATASYDFFFVVSQCRGDLYRTFLAPYIMGGG